MTWTDGFWACLSAVGVASILGLAFFSACTLVNVWVLCRSEQNHRRFLEDLTRLLEQFHVMDR